MSMVTQGIVLYVTIESEEAGQDSRIIKKVYLDYLSGGSLILLPLMMMLRD